MAASRWCVYYDTGQVFGDADGPWGAAPAEGVLAVVERQGDRTTVHAGGDFYRLLEDGTVASTDDAATLLRAVGRVELGPILFGRFASNTKMAAVFRRIRDEWGVG